MGKADWEVWVWVVPPHSIFNDPSRASSFITSKNLPSYKAVIDFHRRCAYISSGPSGGGGGGGREEWVDEVIVREKWVRAEYGIQREPLFITFSSLEKPPVVHLGSQYLHHLHFTNLKHGAAWCLNDKRYILPATVPLRPTFIICKWNGGIIACLQK